MLRLPVLSCALVALAVTAAPASAQAPTDPGGPLVYTFVLDGLDGDRVDAGRAPFIAKLLAGGEGARSTYFRESRSIMVAETNPNHTAMVTGAYAERSGIPGNSFAVYNASDGSTCPAGPTNEAQAPITTDGTSPECLQAETIFEATRRQPGAQRNVTAGIFGKPKLASLFGGKKVDPARYDADYLWTPCASPSDDKPYCKQVPNRGFDEYSVLDSTVMDEVLRTVREGVAGDGKTFTGGGRRPNQTFVNFPGIDSSGHATGAGPEYDGAIGRADQQIERFVAEQKRLGLWGRTVIVLLSDHSMDTTPEKSSLTQRFNQAGIASSSYKIVQNGSAALVYLTDRTAAGRFTLLAKMRAAATDGANPLTPLLGPPAVEALYREPNPADGGAADTVAQRHPAWRLTGPRAGDLVVTARSSAAFSEPVNPLAGNHGGPQTRDNLLAVVGGSDLVNQRAIESAQDPLYDDTERNPTQAENVDVAPTIMRLLGLAPPAQSQGRVLTEALRADRLPVLGQAPGGPGTPGAPGAPGGGQAGGSCRAGTGFGTATATGAARGALAFAFTRRTRFPVTVELFESSVGRRVLSKRVARFTGRTRSFRWAGRRGLRDGIYVARLRVRGTDGRTDVARVAVERRRGRFVRLAAFDRRGSCGAIAAFKLEAPVFGGRTNRALGVSYRLGRAGRVTVEVLRGSRVVRRLGATTTRAAGRTFRLRVSARGLRVGSHRVRVRVTGAGSPTTAALTARRL